MFIYFMLNVTCDAENKSRSRHQLKCDVWRLLDALSKRLLVLFKAHFKHVTETNGCYHFSYNFYWLICNKKMEINVHSKKCKNKTYKQPNDLENENG